MQDVLAFLHYRPSSSYMYGYRPFNACSAVKVLLLMTEVITCLQDFLPCGTTATQQLKQTSFIVILTCNVLLAKTPLTQEV